MKVATKKGLQRNCGKRTKGSVYGVSRFLEADLSLRNMLICEPWPVDLTQLGLSSIGIVVMQYPGTNRYDIYDLVGSSYYTIAEFVEEASHREVSRKVDQIMGPQLSLITPDSNYFFVHHEAIVHNFDELYNDRIGLENCPTGIEHHDNNELFSACLGLQWEMMGQLPKNKTDREFTAELPRRSIRPTGEPAQHTFQAAHYPKGFVPETSPGIFMWMPASLMMFEVIEDEVDHSEDKALQMLQQFGSNIPYMIVEE